MLGDAAGPACKGLGLGEQQGVTGDHIAFCLLIYLATLICEP